MLSEAATVGVNIPVVSILKIFIVKFSKLWIDFCHITYNDVTFSVVYGIMVKNSRPSQYAPEMMTIWNESTRLASAPSTLEYLALDNHQSEQSMLLTVGVSVHSSFICWLRVAWWRFPTCISDSSQQGSPDSLSKGTGSILDRTLPLRASTGCMTFTFLLPFLVCFLFNLLCCVYAVLVFRLKYQICLPIIFTLVYDLSVVILSTLSIIEISAAFTTKLFISSNPSVSY